MQKIIGPLTDPAAYGGDPADAFDVIAPSLPGFAFSSPLTTEGMFFNTVADLWVKLMARLGYDRFATQGGDIGAFVSARLGHVYADKIIGVHLHLAGPLMPPYPTAEDFAPEELAWGAKFAKFMTDGNAYMQVQRTKPQTIGFAMHDSPVGLASWLIDKRRAWSDCGGDVESVFSKDDLITSVMLYWLTDTYVSAARHYYEIKTEKLVPVHDRQPPIEAPTALLQFENDVWMQPRKWAERYYNLKRWNIAKRVATLPRWKHRRCWWRMYGRFSEGCGGNPFYASSKTAASSNRLPWSTSSLPFRRNRRAASGFSEFTAQLS